MAPAKKDAHGAYYFEGRNGAVFQHILNYLHNRFDPGLISETEKKELIVEADFYALKGLQALVGFKYSIPFGAHKKGIFYWLGTTHGLQEPCTFYMHDGKWTPSPSRFYTNPATLGHVGIDVCWKSENPHAFIDDVLFLPQTKKYPKRSGAVVNDVFVDNWPELRDEIFDRHYACVRRCTQKSPLEFLCTVDLKRNRSLKVTHYTIMNMEDMLDKACSNGPSPSVFILEGNFLA